MEKPEPIDKNAAALLKKEKRRRLKLRKLTENALKSTRPQIDGNELIRLVVGNAKVDGADTICRINNLKSVYAHDQLHTFESYGLMFFAGKDGKRINGELREK